MINSSSHLFAHKVCCQPYDLISPGSPIPDWHKYLMIVLILFSKWLCAWNFFIYYASLCKNRAGVDPRVELVPNVKPLFGKWDALLSRYWSNSLFGELSHFLYVLQNERASYIPHKGWAPWPHQDCFGIQRYIWDMMSPHPNNPLIYSVGVAQISGGSFFLRSRFKRLRSPFQDTPVYMVTRT